MKFIDEMIDRKRRESTNPFAAETGHTESAAMRADLVPPPQAAESEPGPPPGFDRSDLPEPLSWPPRGPAEAAAPSRPAPSMALPGRRPSTRRIAPAASTRDLEVEDLWGDDDPTEETSEPAYGDEAHADASLGPAAQDTPQSVPMQAQTRPLTMFDQGRRRSTSPLRLIDPIEEAERDASADTATAEAAPIPDTPPDASPDTPPDTSDLSEAQMPTAGRVKTRLLGFHTREEAADPFASAPSAATAGRFPVGWLVVESGPGRGAAFALYDGMSTIGRGEGQTVQLDLGDTAISRDTHAAVAYDDEARACFLGHGGKANLVRLNGRPVLSTEQISHGDRIRLGETTLRFAALCGADFSWSDEAEVTGSSGEGGTDAAAH